MSALLKSSQLFSLLFYFSIVIGLFAIGDWLGTKTKARLSSIFFVFITFLILFLLKIVPSDIIDKAGLTVVAKWSMPLLVFHMGTMINVRQLIDEWKTVVTAMIGMFASVVGILCIIPLVGREAALCSIPVINGALVATQIMTEAATAKGFTLAAALCPVVFAIQKFVGTPIVSRSGLLEGRKLIAEYRDSKAKGITLSAKNLSGKDEMKPEKAKLTFYQKHEKYYSTNMCLFITVFGGAVSVALGMLTGINYSILALIISVAISETGLLPERILDRAKASGFITTVTFAAIIPALAKVSIGDLSKLLFQVVCIFGITIVANFLFVCILPGWKLIGSKSLAFGVAMCQMLGFPSTFLISNEIANALSDNDEEKEYLMEKIMPKFVVSGLASVTTLSIIVAGIFANLL